MLLCIETQATFFNFVLVLLLLTLCPAKRGLFHIPNFKINFLKIKIKI